MDVDFAGAIDCFILYLATERGLSENYQLSTKRSLERFADWVQNVKRLSSPSEIELGGLAEYLAAEKERGLAPGSMKLVVVALKIFFRFLKMRLMIDRDPAELLPLPRLTRFLPETMNEVQVNHLLEINLQGRPFPLRAEIVAGLDRSTGQSTAAAGAARQRRHVAGQLCDDPVPETAAGRRVRVVTRHREALGLRREA